MMDAILYAVGWLTCGFVGAGWIFSDFQAKGRSTAAEDRRQDLGVSVFLMIGGPFSILVGFLVTGFGQHGWWRPYRKEQGDAK